MQFTNDKRLRKKATREKVNNEARADFLQKNYAWHNWQPGKVSEKPYQRVSICMGYTTA